VNYFFAIKPPLEVCKTLAEYSDRWRDLLGEQRFRWYVPQDYHITLKFLGDLDGSAEEILIAAALPISQKSEPFFVELAGPSGLPNPERFANVLINGIYSNEHLRALQKNISQAMAAVGFPEEARPYLPHITFARCRRRERDIQFVKFEHVFLKCNIDHFVLMQTLPPESRANGAKARYNTVHTFPFRTAHLSDVS